jgi:hypothetical protein
LALVWPLLALGDEDGVLTSGDAASLAAYEVGRTKQMETAWLAAHAKAAATDARKKHVRHRNADLLERARLGKLKRNSAVVAIRRDWMRRGDGGACPSARTLNDWLA